MSRGATARLFVAVDPPAQACERLCEWARAVADAARAAGSARGSLRVLDAESLHLTLCFLGNRPVGEIESLAAALAPCATRACELSAGAPLWLPPRRPHALAVEIHDRGGELLRVQEQLSEALRAASGWQPEPRRFRPHITVARVRGGALGVSRHRGATPGAAGDRSRSGRPLGGRELPATPAVGFAPRAIVLYRSWLARDGASYEPLASSELVLAPR
jgi:RNA 2',3'-cyclic 3'-phosphodiesterase